MITKAQAITLRAAFIESIGDRIEEQIRSAAANGQVSVTVSYFPASPTRATAFINTVLIPNGWTVSLRDDVNFTFVIS